MFQIVFQRKGYHAYTKKKYENLFNPIQPTKKAKNNQNNPDKSNKYSFLKFQTQHESTLPLVVSLSFRFLHRFL